MQPGERASCARCLQFKSTDGFELALFGLISCSLDVERFRPKI